MSSTIRRLHSAWAHFKLVGSRSRGSAFLYLLGYFYLNVKLIKWSPLFLFANSMYNPKIDLFVRHIGKESKVNNLHKKILYYWQSIQFFFINALMGNILK